MLNEAVNQQERGDIVLIKTMLSLNYSERMETKRKYEDTYNSVNTSFKIYITLRKFFILLKNKGIEKRFN